MRWINQVGGKFLTPIYCSMAGTSSNKESNCYREDNWSSAKRWPRNAIFFGRNRTPGTFATITLLDISLFCRNGSLCIKGQIVETRKVFIKGSLKNEYKSIDSFECGYNYKHEPKETPGLFSFMILLLGFKALLSSVLLREDDYLVAFPQTKERRVANFKTILTLQNKPNNFIIKKLWLQSHIICNYVL